MKDKSIKNLIINIIISMAVVCAVDFVVNFCFNRSETSKNYVEFFIPFVISIMTLRDHSNIITRLFIGKVQNPNIKGDGESEEKNE